MTSAKYQSTCRILTAYRRFNEHLPIHRLSESLDTLRHSIEASSRTARSEIDPRLRNLYTHRLINPLQNKLSAYKTKLNHATLTLNSFVFKPKDISEALLPNDRHQLAKAIITSLPKVFTERAQGKSTSYAINQAFASSILMINEEAINTFINTITTKFTKNLYTMDQLKTLARIIINHKLETAATLQAQFNLSPAAATNFPLLFPPTITSDDFVKTITIYNIPPTDNATILALAVVQQAKENLIKDINSFQKTPDHTDKFLMRRILRLNKQSRAKRNIFSEALAGFLGLATSESVQQNHLNLNSINENENKFISAIKNMTERSNLYENIFQNLESSLQSLSRYETDTNSHLQDEHENLIRLGNETDALLNYTKTIEPIIQRAIIILSNIDTFDKIYEEITANIYAIAYNKLPLNLIMDQPEHFSNTETSNVQIKVTITTEGFNVRYDAPTNSKQFIVYNIESLPFPIKNSFFLYRLDKRIAISDDNTHILHTDLERDCTLGPTCTCAPTITIRYGSSCEKSIALQSFNNETTSLCKPKIDVTTSLHQRIIMRPRVATIFTALPDKAEIKCPHTPKETTSMHTGINFIQLGTNCSITTSTIMQTNSNQQTISQTTQINTLNKIIEEGLTNLQTTFGDIHINTLADHLHSLNLTESNLQDNIKNIITNIKHANDHEPLFNLHLSGDKKTNTALQLTLAAAIIITVFLTCCICCTPCGSYLLCCLPTKCTESTCYAFTKRNHTRRAHNKIYKLSSLQEREDDDLQTESAPTDKPSWIVNPNTWTTNPHHNAFTSPSSKHDSAIAQVEAQNRIWAQARAQLEAYNYQRDNNKTPNDDANEIFQSEENLSYLKQSH